MKSPTFSSWLRRLAGTAAFLILTGMLPLFCVAGSGLPQAVIQESDGRRELLITGAEGMSCQLQVSTNLVQWTANGSPVILRCPTGVMRLPAAAGLRQFYRVVCSPSQEPGPSGGPQVVHYCLPAIGAQNYRVAILMINTAGPRAENPVTVLREDYTARELGDAYFASPDGVASFIREASHGKVTLHGSAVGWLELPEQDLSDLDIIQNASHYLGLFSPYIRFNEYDVFVVHALTKRGGAQRGWLYPHQSFNTPQGEVTGVGIDWMINSAVFTQAAPLDSSQWSGGDSLVPTTSWAHELLHTLGIAGHANAYNCGTSVLASTGTTNPIVAYGNPFSVMGDQAYGLHPDLIMKEHLRWIRPSQIVDVTSAGEYQIGSVAEGSASVLGLRLHLDPPVTHTQHSFSFDTMYVEFRKPVGFDRYFARLNGSSFLSQYKPEGPINPEGVLLYLKYPPSTQTDTSLLLDANPTTSFNPNRGIHTLGTPGKFADAMLPTGKSFSYENGRLIIEPLGIAPGGRMRVRVTGSSLQ